MFLLKFLGLKWIIGVGTLGVVVVGAGGLYLAVIGGVDIPGLSDALRVDPEPPSPQVIARAAQVEEDIRVAIEDNSAFFLELTDDNLSDLLEAELGSEDRIQNLKVEIRPEDVKVSGELAGRVGVGFSGLIGITLLQGQVELELKSVKLSSLPTPGFVKDEVQPFIDEVLDINERLRESGATQIQAVNLSPGVIRIIGVQADGATVSESTIQAIQNAVGSVPPGPVTVPGGNLVPIGRVHDVVEPGTPIYLALGDSLAANVGVGDPAEGYVSRLHGFLEGARGETLGLRNLGISGESTISIRNGTQLFEALSILQQGNVGVLSINLGANDVLTHLGSADCREGDGGPRGAVCQARIAAAMDAFSPNFRSILAELKAELPANAEFYIMTLYNPFDFGLGLPLEDYSSGIVSDLNDLIRAEAVVAGATVADPFGDMADNARAWTNMLKDFDIHPNTDGYQVLANSFAVARGG